MTALLVVGWFTTRVTLAGPMSVCLSVCLCLCLSLSLSLCTQLPDVFMTALTVVG